MKFFGPLRSCTQSAVLLAMAALSLFALAAARAAMPFDSATVTRVENKVNYGQIKGGRSQTRPASAQDVVKASDFLVSETASRAELKYPDGSIVRVGQNTVFSFDADTRTLILEKGRFMGYIPPGGGCTVKTPSYTAAITGAVFIGTSDTLAMIEGHAAMSDGTNLDGGQHHNVVTGITGNGGFSGGALTQPPIAGVPIGPAPYTATSTLQGAYPDTDNPGVTGPENPQNSASQVEHRNTVADKQNTKITITGSQNNNSDTPHIPY